MRVLWRTNEEITQIYLRQADTVYRVCALFFPGSGADALTVEIPLTPTEAAGANVILLRPVVVERRGVQEGGTALQGCDILVQ